MKKTLFIMILMIFMVSAVSADEASDAMQAMFKTINSQVQQQLGNQLDGTFSVINVLGGVTPYYNDNGNININLYRMIDKVIVKNDNGIYGFGDVSFSTFYEKLLSNVNYVLSTSDNQRVADARLKSSSDINTLVTKYTSLYGPITEDQKKGAGALTDVDYIIYKMNQWKHDGLPFSAKQLQPYITAIENDWGSDGQLIYNQSNAQTRLKGIITNILSPNVDNNGAMKATDSNAYPKYTDLPSQSNLVNGLANDGNKITLAFTYSKQTQNTRSFKVSGGGGFSVGIGFLRIGVSGSSSYEEFDFNKYGANVAVSVTYKGVTLMKANPALASGDATHFWYDADILNQVVDKTGNNITGYQLVSGEYSVDQVFGPGKKLSRCKSYVISKFPDITLNFAEGKLSDFQSQYSAKMSTGISIFGLFNIGGASAQYKESSSSQNASGSGFSITFSAAPMTVIVDPTERTCNVLGGVIQYPPKNN